MEQIIGRGRKVQEEGAACADDTFDTALTRLRMYHKYHAPMMDWLRNYHVPVVNLDCSGSPDNVWEQLLAIGRLMRKATNHTVQDINASEEDPIVGQGPN